MTPPAIQALRIQALAMALEHIEHARHTAKAAVEEAAILFRFIDTGATPADDAKAFLEAMEIITAPLKSWSQSGSTTDAPKRSEDGDPQEAKRQQSPGEGQSDQ